MGIIGGFHGVILVHRSGSGYMQDIADQVEMGCNQSEVDCMLAGNDGRIVAICIGSEHFMHHQITGVSSLDRRIWLDIRGRCLHNGPHT